MVANRIDLFHVAGGEDPSVWVSAVRPGICFHFRGSIIFWIDRETDEFPVFQLRFHQLRLSLCETSRHQRAKVWIRTTRKNKCEAEGISLQLFCFKFLPKLIGEFII